MTKKMMLLMAAMTMTLCMWGVPAKPGFMTKTQPDGTTIEVELRGDENYSYWVDRQGNKWQENAEGQLVPVNESDAQQPAAAPSRAKAQAAPMKAPGRINLAPKGLVILVDFPDQAWQGGTLADFQDMMNGASYNHNSATGSAREYFRAQSGGKYVPDFTVVGPYRMSKNLSYYGEDGTRKDLHIGEMIVEACRAADNAGVDFSQFDNDRDGYVDFVYVLYAGYSQSEGATANKSIWPHNWTLSSARYYEGSTLVPYLRLDNKTIDTYACSSELYGTSGSTRSGIGTFVHEFSHVLGLPDYYDVDYAENGQNNNTPGYYSPMDQGNYLNNGKTPCGYSIYDKYYLGWLTPENLNAPANCSLAAGEGYQINEAGVLAAATSSNKQIYVENRQKSGWDAYIPAAGLWAWEINYNSSDWQNNTINNTTSKTRLKVERITTSSYEPFTDKPLLSITASAGKINFTFIESPTKHRVVATGEGCRVTPSTEKVDNGENVTANIIPSDCYTVSTVVVSLGSTVLTEGTDYTLNAEKTFLTVLGTAITGDADNDLSIHATATQNEWQYVIAHEDHIAVSAEDGCVAKGGNLQLTIAPMLGYDIDWEQSEVYMGGTKLVKDDGFTYENNVLSISSVTGDVEIYAFESKLSVESYTFVPVTEAGQLIEGGKYLLVYQGATPAVAGAMTGQYLASVTSGFTMDNETKVITVPVASVANLSVLTLGGAEGAWTFANGSGQKLAATAEKKLAWTGTANTWTIALSDGKAAIANKTASYGTMKYNSGSGVERFTTYSSGQSDIALYVLSGTEVRKMTTVMSWTKPGDKTLKVGEKSSNVANTNYGTVSYESNNTSVATVDENGMVTANGVGSARITARVTETDAHTAAHISYDVTVEAGDVPTYHVTWMVNGVALTDANAVHAYQSGDALLLPTTEVASCSDGRAFIGWTTAEYFDLFTAPEMFTDATGMTVTEDVTYYAVFGPAE